MPAPKRGIDFSRLVDWMEGRLSAAEARDVEEQLAVADDATLADVAWLNKFVGATKCTVLEPPPPGVRSTLIARFEAYAEGRGRTPGLLKRMFARLTFDSNLRPAVGVRAAGMQGARRQLIYAAEGLDVALNFWPRNRDKTLELAGQVFPHDDMDLGPFSVQLLQDESDIAITVTDDLGGFAFESVLPEVYTIILSTDQIEVSITPVELSA
jgi:hypothetical protein